MSAQYCQACQNGQHCFHVTTNFSQCTCTGDCTQRQAKSSAKNCLPVSTLDNTDVTEAIALLQNHGYRVTKDEHLNIFQLGYLYSCFFSEEASRSSDLQIELVRSMLAPQLDHIKSCELCQAVMAAMNIALPVDF